MKNLFFAAGLVAVLPQCSAEQWDLTKSQRDQLALAVKSQLKDPNSAVFEWNNIRDYADQDDLVKEYCFLVNAKNGFGGYVGFQEIWSDFRLLNSALVDIQIHGLGGKIVESSCNEIRKRIAKVRNHDPRISYDQAKAGCFIDEDGKLACGSPGTGMCWERNHDPRKGEQPARAVDAVAEHNNCG